MRTNIYLIIVLSTICFSSCYREKDLKYSLNAAGKNRIELEKVLEHYKDSGPKYDAACFLIKNMPGYYSYAKSSGLDSLRKIQSVIFHKKHFDNRAGRGSHHFPYGNFFPSLFHIAG